MPETIRSLIVILAIGSLILYFHKIRLPKIVSANEFKQWQFLWITSSFSAFLSNNYWLFVLILIAILKLRVKGKRATQFASYMWLLPLLPVLEKDIPGFANIRFLFELSYPRVLSLIILLPLFLSQTDKKMAFLRLPGDKILTLYLLVSIFITTRNGDITNILRSNLYLFTDIFLPYYVASRAFTDLHDFKKIAFVIFCSVSILAAIALFETIKGWHLYSSLSYSLDIGQRFSAYLFRGGLLRASGPFSSPIVMGYVLTIGLGMGFAIHSSFRNKKHILLLFLLYALALLSTTSRGPWVGVFVLCMIFILLNRNKARLISKGILAVAACSPIIIFTSYGQKIIQLLPFIGKSNEGSISYRQELLEKSWIVIQRHPLFGSNTYLDTPEMQSMIQGQGIIDIVNTYIRIALNSGLIGLGLFVFFFVSLLIRLYLAQKKITHDQSEVHLFAISLIAIIASVLVIIATVSSIDIVSYLYWILAGIISAYLHFLKHNESNRLQIS